MRTETLTVHLIPAHQTVVLAAYHSWFRKIKSTSDASRCELALRHGFIHLFAIAAVAFVCRSLMYSAALQYLEPEAGVQSMASIIPGPVGLSDLAPARAAAELAVHRLLDRVTADRNRAGVTFYRRRHDHAYLRALCLPCSRALRVGVGAHRTRYFQAAVDAVAHPGFCHLLPSVFNNSLSLHLCSCCPPSLGVWVIRAAGVRRGCSKAISSILGSYQLEVAEACSGLRHVSAS